MEKVGRLDARHVHREEIALIIDSHQHFWHYNEREFDWITPEMSVLRADFGPAQLQASCREVGVQGAVSVQARRSLDETEWLMAIADEHDWIVGVVGWVDLAAPNVADVLDRYAAHPKFVGVREVCQGAPVEAFFVNKDFNRGVAQLASRDLAYDILIYADQLLAAIEFVDRHPEQSFVVDHCAKPPISRAEFANFWAQNINELARRDNVVCKLSGLTTEVRGADRSWDVGLLRPYFETVLQAFGPSRLMFGSDWPVSLLFSTYRQWIEACDALTASLQPSERDDIYFGVAKRVYHL